MRCRGLKGDFECDAQVSGNDGFCSDCVKLRRQMTTSHELEGHSHMFVPMCILCERLAGMGGFG